MILGKDWLDMVNPLVDWCSNTVYIRSGDQLHRVSGIPSAEVKPCGIVDRGLSGLENNFLNCIRRVLPLFKLEKWGEIYKQLASPSFWEYKTTAKD